jgi:serine/threonine protein phosphatase 1
VSKWRPVITECLYTIADIHGEADLLNKILKRILPLRKSDGIHDKIVFLGDYVDRHKDGHKVLDALIKLKAAYDNNVFFLIGNHELLMLQALKLVPGSSVAYDLWMQNGGYYTLTGYIERAGLTVDPLSLNVDRVLDIIPAEHIYFLVNNLHTYCEIDNFLFVHAGCDPLRHVDTCDLDTLVWDRTLYELVLKAVQDGVSLSWDKTIVTGHNSGRGKGIPVITDKYLMLDCGSPKRLLITELNSMESYMAYPDKDRLIKKELQETVKTAFPFRRV